MLFFGNAKVFECLHFEIIRSVYSKPVPTIQRDATLSRQNTLMASCYLFFNCVTFYNWSLLELPISILFCCKIFHFQFFINLWDPF